MLTHRTLINKMVATMKVIKAIKITTTTMMINIMTKGLLASTNIKAKANLVEEVMTPKKIPRLSAISQ